MFKGLKKLMMWFQTRQRIINQFEKMDKIAEARTAHVLKKLEALDQGKVYLCCIEGASMAEIDRIKEIYAQASMRLRWSPPHILFVNQEIRELSKQETELIVSRQKKNKVTK